MNKEMLIFNLSALLCLIASVSVITTKLRLTHLMYNTIVQTQPPSPPIAPIKPISMNSFQDFHQMPLTKMVITTPPPVLTTPSTVPSSANRCRECVSIAAADVLQKCPIEKESVIWYSECMLRYSSESFFSMVTEVPAIILMNTGSISEQSRFLELLGQTMNKSVSEAANGNGGSTGKKFATEEAKFPSFHNLYTLAQCTPDLSVQDCNRCLRIATGNLQTDKQGERVLIPSCNVRYEMYQFYTGVLSPTPAESPPPPEGKSGISAGIIVAIVVSTMLALVLLIFACLFINRRRPKMKFNSVPEESVEISSVEFLQFDLDTIKVATNNFCDDNKLGEGGFGEVYKVWLGKEEFSSADMSVSEESYHRAKEKFLKFQALSLEAAGGSSSPANAGAREVPIVQVSSEWTLSSDLPPDSVVSEDNTVNLRKRKRVADRQKGKAADTITIEDPLDDPISLPQFSMSGRKMLEAPPDVNIKNLDSLFYEGTDIVPFVADRLLLKKDYEENMEVASAAGPAQYGRMVASDLARSFSQVLSLIPFLASQEKMLEKFKGINPDTIAELQTKLDCCLGELHAVKENLRESEEEKERYRRSADDLQKELELVKKENEGLANSLVQREGELCKERSMAADRERSLQEAQAALAAAQKALDNADLENYGMFLRGFAEAKAQIKYFNPNVEIDMSQVSEYKEIWDLPPSSS